MEYHPTRCFRAGVRDVRYLKPHLTAKGRVGANHIRSREYLMDRRSFIKKAGVAAGATAAATTLATPAIAQATKDLVVVATWPRDFPRAWAPAPNALQRASIS